MGAMPRTMEAAKCKGCGAGFERIPKTKRSHPKIYCSTSCRTPGKPRAACPDCGGRREHRKRKLCLACRRREVRRNAASRKLSQAAGGIGQSRTWFDCRCDECGTRSLTAWPARFCSKKCKRRHHSAARRSSGIRSAIRRLAIYERDNWICQLCGEPVDRTLVFRSSSRQPWTIECRWQRAAITRRTIFSSPTSSATAISGMAWVGDHPRSQPPRTLRNFSRAPRRSEWATGRSSRKSLP